MNFDEFKNNIISACRKLEEVDKALFDLGHHEETINHRLAVHLTGLFNEHDVDVEYSLNNKDQKRDTNDKRVRPDIVIHKRGNNNRNLAIIEIKRFNNSHSDKDKIKKYRNLEYKYGVIIKFNKDGSLKKDKTEIFKFNESKWYDIE